MVKSGPDHFTSYKQRRLIDGSVFILHSYCEHVQTTQSEDSIPVDQFPVFQVSTNLNLNPPASSAVDNKADTLTQSQMLKDSDRAHFVASQQSEIRGLQHMEVFDVQPISTLPTSAKLLNSIWSYHRKQSPVGTILKYKSRLCVDGSQQLHGRDFWETSAPVISWTTVRLLLLLSTILDLKTRQVDYT